MPTPKRRRSQPRRRVSALRWAALATLAVVALLYYRPLKSYVETRTSVHQRQEEVRQLRAKRNRLAKRLEQAETPEALEQRARKLGLVKPGEQLFIVKGIDQWRRKARARLGGDG
jgi:cell division protein FtsB